MKIFDRLRSHRATERENAIQTYRRLAHAAALAGDLPEPELNALIEAARHAGKAIELVEADIAAIRDVNDLEPIAALANERMAAHKSIGRLLNDHEVKSLRIAAELKAERESIIKRRGAAADLMQQSMRARDERINLIRANPDLFEHTESEAVNEPE